MKANNNEQLRSVGPQDRGLPSPGSLRRAGACLMLGLGLSLLGACGQKGPLYQAPPQPQTQPKPSPSVKAPSTAASAALP